MVSYFFLTFDSFIITLCNINITFDCNFVTYLHALVNKLVFIHLSPRISVSNILKDCAQSKIYILMHYKNENIQSVLVVLSYSYWTKMCKYYKNNTRLTNIYIYIYIFGGLAQPPMHVEICGKLLPCTRKWTDVHKPSLMSYDHRSICHLDLKVLGTCLG